MIQSCYMKCIFVYALNTGRSYHYHVPGGTRWKVCRLLRPEQEISRDLLFHRVTHEEAQTDQLKMERQIFEMNSHCCYAFFFFSSKIAFCIDYCFVEHCSI